MEELFKVAQVRWVAVGQRPPKMIPNKFVRVEFGRVPREGIGAQTGMPSEELFDEGSFMGVGAIPQKNHMAAPVSEQLPEEGHDLDDSVHKGSCYFSQSLVRTDHRLVTLEILDHLGQCTL